MLLHLPGGSVNAAARVLRSEAQPRDAAIAVRFDELSSLSSAAIDAAIAEGFQRAAWDSSARPEPNALVVGQPLYLRETLVNELRSLGLEAAPMPTPLDALVFLERPASRVRVVIAIHSRHTNGRELLSFLAETRPETLRVLLSESKRSLTGSHPESAPAHAVLTKPWDLRTLVRSMTTNP
jgi:CheY-like chemotaxis protein